MRLITVLLLAGIAVPGLSHASEKAPPKVISLAAESGHTCAVLESGQVVCWGRDEVASLGILWDHAWAGPFGIAAVPNVPAARSVAVGRSTTCVVTREGKVVCWGKPWVTATPSKGEWNPDPVGPTVVPKLDRVIQVSLSKAHACALRSSGDVWCWGPSDSVPFWLGAAAKGREAGASLPEKIRGLGPATSLSSAELQTCAVLRDGGVSCWGLEGQPEFDDEPGFFGPRRVAGLKGVKRFELGKLLGCALLRNDAIQCLEFDPVMRKVSASRGGTNQPVTMSQVKLKKLTALSMPKTALFDGCALDAKGSVHCWGDNRYGQAGDPVDLPKATAIAAAEGFTCAALAEGGVRCWGSNDDAELGRIGRHPEPVEVPLVELFDDPTCQPSARGTIRANLRTDAIRSLAVTMNHACAVLHDGRVACWTSSEVRGREKAEAVVVPLGKPAVHVASGYSFNCAAMETGRVSCWDQDTATITEIAGVEDAVQVVADQGTTCALHSTGEVSCWDHGCDGFCPAQRLPRLCDASRLWVTEGEYSDRERLFVAHANGGVSLFYLDELARTWRQWPRSPLPLEGVGGFLSVAANRYELCGIKADGVVACSEDPDEKFIQDSSLRSPLPVPRAGMPPTSEVFLTEQVGCALQTTGQVACWTSEGPFASSETHIRGAHLLDVGNGQACAAVGHQVYCWDTSWDAIRGSKKGNVPQPIRVPMPVSP